MDILNFTDHRPYPLPDRPWIMTQTWERLLFAHWPVPAADVRELLPQQLELDTFDGTAWIGILPFHIRGFRPRGLPALPYLSAFPEINVRTYVVHDGKPGVYFFSLDAANAAAVALARGCFHLPYYRAKMRMERCGKGWRFESARTHRHAPKFGFRTSYAPISEVYRASAGSIDEWLTERYCLYTSHSNKLYCGDIHHLPCPLQLAEAEFERSEMAPGFSRIFSGGGPLLHYAESMKTLMWPLICVRD